MTTVNTEKMVQEYQIGKIDNVEQFINNIDTQIETIRKLVGIAIEGGMKSISFNPSITNQERKVLITVLRVITGSKFANVDSNDTDITINLVEPVNGDPSVSLLSEEIFSNDVLTYVSANHSILKQHWIAYAKVYMFIRNVKNKINGEEKSETKENVWNNLSKFTLDEVYPNRPAIKCTF